MRVVAYMRNSVAAACFIIAHPYKIQSTYVEQWHKKVESYSQLQFFMQVINL